MLWKLSVQICSMDTLAWKYIRFEHHCQLWVYFSTSCMFHILQEVYAAERGKGKLCLTDPIGLTYFVLSFLVAVGVTAAKSSFGRQYRFWQRGLGHWCSNEASFSTGVSVPRPVNNFWAKSSKKCGFESKTWLWFQSLVVSQDKQKLHTTYTVYYPTFTPVQNSR